MHPGARLARIRRGTDLARTPSSALCSHSGLAHYRKRLEGHQRRRFTGNLSRRKWSTPQLDVANGRPALIELAYAAG
jgi:hypothetical protein